jgi:uncharacterized protein (DUF952 family)
MFVGVHVYACMHRAWKHANNLGQYTNNIRGCARAHVHTQHFKSCTELGAVYNPHISAKWSQIFMKLSAYVKIGLLSWLIMFVGVYVHACTHREWKHVRNLGQYTNPHISAKRSQIFMKLSAYVKIGLLSWLIMFLGVQVNASMHRAWKHACNLGQYTNLHISAKWSQIFMKLSAYIKISLLSWLIMFLDVYMNTCMHSAWKHACNLRQYSNPDISAK